MIYKSGRYVCDEILILKALQKHKRIVLQQILAYQVTLIGLFLMTMRKHLLKLTPVKQLLLSGKWVGMDNMH